MSRRRSARRARTVATVAVLLVLALVAVLVGLVGSGGSGAVPAGTGASAHPTSVRIPGLARTTSTPRASPAATRSTGSTAGRDAETGLRVVALGTLPREAQATVARIDAGGPFPYAQDGATFGNVERLLPAHPRGWYHEYTVRTSGERDRGPRRIVTGDDDRVIFYTADHYGSFVRVAR